jgi:hypothetical protein
MNIARRLMVRMCAAAALASCAPAPVAHGDEPSRTEDNASFFALVTDLSQIRPRDLAAAERVLGAQL